MTCVPSRESDQSLLCALWVAKDPNLLQRDSQDSDLSLHWVQRSFGWFCHASAQMISIHRDKGKPTNRIFSYVDHDAFTQQDEVKYCNDPKFSEADMYGQTMSTQSDWVYICLPFCLLF